MTPKQDLTDHDLLVEMHTAWQEVVKPTFEKLEKGELAPCQVHSTQIDSIRRKIAWMWTLLVMCFGTVLAGAWKYFTEGGHK